MKFKVSFLGILVVFLFSQFSLGTEFKKIMDLAPGNWGNLYYYQNTLYVSEMTQDLIYALRRNKLSTIPMPQGYRSAPDQMIGFENNLFVSTTGGMFLTLVDTNGFYVKKEWSVRPELIGPGALAIENQMLYVADTGTRQILPIKLSTLKKIKPLFSGPGPLSMAVSKGKIFVISSENIFYPELRIIRVFESTTGQALLQYDPKQQGEKGVYTAIHKSSDGTVYVISVEDQLLLAFNPDTLVIKKIKLRTHNPVSVASIGNQIIILDGGPRRNETYDPNGGINLTYKPVLEILSEEPKQIDLFELSNHQIVLPSLLETDGLNRIFIRSENFSNSSKALLSEIIL